MVHKVKNREEVLTHYLTVLNSLLTAHNLCLRKNHIKTI